MAKETYLVTGAAGFIGSNLVETLLKEGQRVKGLDNFVTGRRVNLAPFKDKIEFIEGDICNLELLRSIMKDVDYVLHQAAIPSVARSVEDPIASNQANVDGTLNVLQAAKESGVKRVVFASSSSIYGDSTVTPKTEELQPNPISPYATSKYVGELYCKNFHRLYGLETVCLRYFNIFGPRQNPKSEYSAAIPKFITAALNGKEITVFGDGKQSRDFTFVENVVNANLLACQAKAAAGESFNIGCAQQTNLLSLVKIIAELVGRNFKVAHSDPRKGDVRSSLAAVEKAKKMLGYEPKVQIREGLVRAVEWFKRDKE